MNPKNHNLYLLSFIFFLGFLTRVSISLDVFFFGKYYNQGHCKNKGELDQYLILDDNKKIVKNQMIRLGMSVPDQPMIKFGIFFTRNKKSELSGVHQFFNFVLESLGEEERSYFPDLISCVSEIPFFSFFGLRDDYGLLYRLSPTLEDYQANELSANPFSFIDLVEVFLDAFKATQVMISKGFFMNELESDGVGITLESHLKNVHVRGKLRKLHELRSGGNCSPSAFPVFHKLKSSFETWNQLQAKKLHLNFNKLNTCQAINMYTLWDSFLYYVTKYFREEKVKQFLFDNCLQDFVDTSDCPEELSILWNDMKLRKKMRNFRSASISYTSESINLFLIYVLERLKASQLEAELIESQNLEDQLVARTTQNQQQYKQEEAQMTELERLEMEILNAVPQKKEKIDQLAVSYKQEINVYVQNKGDLRGQERLELERKFNNPLRDGQFMEKVVVELKNADLNKEAGELVNLEMKKNGIKIEEKQLLDKVGLELEAQKSKVRARFKSVVKRALIESRKHKIEVDKYGQEIQRVKELKTKVHQEIKLLVQNQNSSPNRIRIDRDSTSFDELTNSTEITLSKDFENKINLSQTTDKKEKKPEQSESSEISDYLDDSQNSSEEQLSFESEMGAIPDGFEREDLDIDGLVLDLDSEEKGNSQLITKYEGEVVSREEEVSLDRQAKQMQEKSERSEIIADQELNETNTGLVVKHELIGSLLNTVSLKVELREVQKLEQIREIMQLKKQILDLVEKSASEGQIRPIEEQIEQKINALVSEFGEAEILFLEDKGVGHYTIGDLKEDLSLDEFKYIYEQPQLQLDDQASQIFV